MIKMGIYYKNHAEFMRYKARMEAEERRNNTFAERLVLVVEIELRDLWFMEKEILNEVAKLMRLWRTWKIVNTNNGIK